MEPLLTYEQLMNLFIETRNQIKEQSAEFNKNLEKSIEKSRKEFEEEIKRSRKEFEEEIKRSRELSEKENAKLSQQIGRLGGTWGRFVEEMIQPKIVEMFQEKGIAIEMSARSVKAVKDSNIYYEIDILLVNTNVAVAIEVKSTLSIEDINEHIERLDKIKQVAPKLFNLSGMIIYGAVAGIIIEREADKYAYKKGLFVIRQKGNIVEIANDSKFIPKEWKVEY